MSASVADKIKDAIEASYYVEPVQPGLTYDELAAVMAATGFHKGEVDVALDMLLRRDLAGTPAGLIFLDESRPIWLREPGAQLSFVGDPRDRQTAGYVQEMLRERARRLGVDQTIATISEVVSKGLEDGHGERQLHFALRWLELLELAEVDRVGGDIRGTSRTLTWGRLSGENVIKTPSKRDGFGPLLAEVQGVIDRRSPRVRWKHLEQEIAAIPRLSLSGEQQLVLTDVLNHFANRGETRSLADTKRTHRTLAVHEIHAELERMGLLHAKGDTTVFPSLLAIHQAPGMFSALLLMIDRALRDAEHSWDKKQVRPLLKGASGLVNLGKNRNQEDEKALRQLEILVEGMSLLPCLAPAPPSVEIRDSIVECNSLASLLRHKVSANAQREEKTRMPDPKDVFVVHGRDSKRKTYFFDLLRRMGLNPIEFDEAIALTGSGSPYIGDVVKTALERAMAVVVLFTGDDLASLRPDLLGADDGDSERTPTPQPRQNVILEAGMALALDRDRTIIVEVHPLRSMSDLHGMHVVRFKSGDATECNRLRQRLETAGCAVKKTGNDWLTLPFPQ